MEPIKLDAQQIEEIRMLLIEQENLKLRSENASLKISLAIEKAARANGVTNTNLQMQLDVSTWEVKLVERPK